MTQTKILKIDSTSPDLASLESAAVCLRQELCVVFPTETVYGLGCDVASRKAVQSVYDIKGRAFDKPLAIMISDLAMLDSVAADITEQARKLMRAFWPGPLTIVFKAKAGTLPTVGVRFPDHPVPLNLIRGFGKPIAATSANLSGSGSPADAAEAIAQLDGKVPLILDGGPCTGGKESTVVDCASGEIKILRAGALAPETVLKAAAG